MSDPFSLSLHKKATAGLCKPGLCGRLLVLLTAALLVLPLSSAAQTTQTLSLDAGWNLVSLHVEPDDASFASIFNGTMVSIVKNENGEAYLPGRGIEQISTWETDQGYQVHAEAATTLDVTGTEITPGATAIELEKGGNVVPYLSTQAQAVEEALVTIDESLVAVEDEKGRQYDPSASSSPLDSLRPGQGYKVYIDRADTLRYPKVVQTLDDALVLTGASVGSHVRVRGYHEPGDGGGGLFRVNDSACRTDGGTCFIFDEDLSTQQTLQTDNKLRTDPGTDVGNTDLSWRTIELKWGPNQEEKWPIQVLHGHIPKGKEVGRYVDTKAGTIGAAGGNGIWVTARDLRSSDPGYNFEIRYKHATSTRRLERVGVTDAVNVAWWGAKPTSEGWTEWTDRRFRPADDNTWAFNWAANAARRLLLNDSNLSTAYVDVADRYYTLFGTLIPDNVVFRGIGPIREVGEANIPTRGGAVLAPGEVLWYERTDRTYSSSLWEGTQMKKWGFHPGHYAEEKIRFENFEVDGNLQNNQEPFNDNALYGGGNNIVNVLQNKGGWTPYSDRGANALNTNDYPNTKYAYIEGLNLEVVDSALHNHGSNGIVGNQDLVTSNALFEGGIRNHSTYHFEGNPTDVIIEGLAWGAHVKGPTFKDAFQDNYTPGDNLKEAHFRNGPSADHSITYSNLTFQNLEPNPIFGWGTLINAEAAHFTVDGFSADARGIFKDDGTRRTWTNSSMLFVNANSFPGFIAKNGTIYTPDDGVSEFGLWKGLKAPWSFQDYEITRFTNITIESGGGPTILFTHFRSSTTNLHFKDITLNATSSYGGGTLAAGYMNIGAFNQRYPGPKRVQIENTNWNMPVGHIGELGGFNSPPKVEQDLFISGSTINNQDGWSIRIKKESQGNAMGEFERLYLSNTTFSVPTSGLDGDDRFHYAFTDGTRTWEKDKGYTIKGGSILRIRNCTTPNGRVSDSENNTFTSGSPSEGRDYVLIPTSLLSRPREVNTTLTSGSPNVSSITSVEVANSDGSLRPDSDPLEHDPYLKVNLDGTIGSGESVTIDWTARVTPKSEYTTTGVFIARKHIAEDRTFQSGNGPFTIDLRGLAASQETWTPPAYSASSSDTGVVTANVTASDHRGTDRFYTLELTEQSAGTATITVDAEIPGVGTATTTFKVTVE